MPGTSGNMLSYTGQSRVSPSCPIAPTRLNLACSWIYFCDPYVIYNTVCLIVGGSSFLSFLHVKHSFCPVGHNFCAEAPKCGENSECKNWNTKATCECKNGYISVQGNSAYCEGKVSQVLWGSGREVYFQLLQIWIWLCKGISSHGLSSSFM